MSNATRSLLICLCMTGVCGLVSCGKPAEHVVALDVAQGAELLAQAKRALESESLKRAVPLVVLLESDNPALQKLGISLLSNLELSRSLHTSFEEARLSKKQEQLAQAKKDILDWAKGHDEKTPTGQARNVSDDSAANAICAMWATDVRYGIASEEAAEHFLRDLVAILSASIEDPAVRDTTLSYSGMMIDAQGFRDPIDYDRAKGARRSGRTEASAALLWIRDNLKYCYYHPEQRTFALDAESFKSKQPSREYRKRVPWVEGTGPRQTDPTKVPTL